MKKVPLRIVVDGKKIDIGEAVVDISSDGAWFDVTGEITKEEYRHLLGQHSGVSIGFRPSSTSAHREYSIEDATLIPKKKFKASIPTPSNTIFSRESINDGTSDAP